MAKNREVAAGRVRDIAKLHLNRFKTRSGVVRDFLTRRQAAGRPEGPGVAEEFAGADDKEGAARTTCNARGEPLPSISPLWIPHRKRCWPSDLSGTWCFSFLRPAMKPRTRWLPSSEATTPRRRAGR